MRIRRTATAMIIATVLALPFSVLTTGPAAAEAGTGSTPAAVAPAGAAAVAPAGYVPVDPVRVIDTRNWFTTPRGSTDPVGPGENLTVPLAPFAGHTPPRRNRFVPSDATAVVVNVTATDTTGDSYLSLSATAGAPGAVPATSSLNFRPGETIANLVTVPVTVGLIPGETAETAPLINVYNHVGSVHVIVDVLGYYRPGAADKYEPTTPTRLLDTREGGGTKIGPDTIRSLEVGRFDGATAVVLNVTVTEPDAASFLTVVPPAQYLPQTSSLNFTPGQTVPNQVVVPLHYGDRINLYNHVGSVHVIVDLVGYYSPQGHGLYSPLTPARLYDSRTTGAKRPPYGSTTVPVAGRAGVPAEATSAALNVTVTEPDTAGHLIVHPTGTTRPDTSNVNFTAGQTSANGVTARLGGGSVDIANRSGATHEIVDVTGYFTNG